MVWALCAQQREQWAGYPEFGALILGKTDHLASSSTVCFKNRRFETEQPYSILMHIVAQNTKALLWFAAQAILLKRQMALMFSSDR